MVISVGEKQAKILKAMKKGYTVISAIANVSGVNIATVRAALISLQAKGLVEKGEEKKWKPVPHKRYIVKKRPGSKGILSGEERKTTTGIRSKGGQITQITKRHALVLKEVRNGGVTPSWMARMIGASRTDVGGVLKELEKKGLVKNLGEHGEPEWVVVKDKRWELKGPKKSPPKPRQKTVDNMFEGLELEIANILIKKGPTHPYLIKRALGGKDVDYALRSMQSKGHVKKMGEGVGAKWFFKTKSLGKGSGARKKKKIV